MHGALGQLRGAHLGIQGAEGAVDFMRRGDIAQRARLVAEFQRAIDDLGVDEWQIGQVLEAGAGISAARPTVFASIFGEV